MHITTKLREALLLAACAPTHTLVRCHEGFRQPRATGSAATITRRTANVLVNASLADYNERIVPSSLTLTAKGIEVAQELMPEAPPHVADAFAALAGRLPAGDHAQPIQAAA